MSDGHHRQHFRQLIFLVGVLSVVPAGVCFFAAVAGMMQDRWGDALAFGIACGVQTAVAAGSRHFLKKNKQYPEATIAGAIAWLLLPAVNAIPLFILGMGASGDVVIPYSTFTDAYFESMSAWTSTGLSLVQTPSGLPASIQLWRSLSQWAGGMGVAIFAGSLLRSNTGLSHLATVEVVERYLNDDVAKAIPRVLLLYSVLTSLIFGGYWMCGMPWWEALNHALTTASTGGMSVTDTSFQAYAPSIKVVGILGMVAGACSFGAMLAAVSRRSLWPMLKSPQVQLLGAVLVAGAFLTRQLVLGTDVDLSLVDVSFEWTSAVTTCGLSVGITHHWPQAAHALFIIAMIAGGNAASTAGGIKLARIVWLLKDFFRRVRNTAWIHEDALPERVHTFGPEELDKDEAKRLTQSAGSLLAIWLATLSVGAFLTVLLAPSVSWRVVVFDVASALSGVGLSAGLLTPDLSPMVKGLLTLFMWMGRLEIVAAIAILFVPLTTATRFFRGDRGSPKPQPDAETD